MRKAYNKYGRQERMTFERRVYETRTNSEGGHATEAEAISGAASYFEVGEDVLGRTQRRKRVSNPSGQR